MVGEGLVLSGKWHNVGTSCGNVVGFSCRRAPCQSALAKSSNFPLLPTSLFSGREEVIKQLERFLVLSLSPRTCSQIPAGTGLQEALRSELEKRRVRKGWREG